MRRQLSNRLLSRLDFFSRREFRSRSKVKVGLNKIGIRGGFLLLFLRKIYMKKFYRIYIWAANHIL